MSKIQKFCLSFCPHTESHRKNTEDHLLSLPFVSDTVPGTAGHLPLPFPVNQSEEKRPED